MAICHPKRSLSIILSPLAKPKIAEIIPSTDDTEEEQKQKAQFGVWSLWLLALQEVFKIFGMNAILSALYLQCFQVALLYPSSNCRICHLQLFRNILNS